MDLPWPSRAEEGLRVDLDTLRYLKKMSSYVPKCEPNLGGPKSKMAAGGSKYPNPLSNLPLLSVVTGVPYTTLL